VSRQHRLRQRGQVLQQEAWRDRDPCQRLSLYAAMIAAVVLGFCFRWSQHVPLSVFGWFAIPSPLAFGTARRR
jgi:cytochrome b561